MIRILDFIYYFMYQLNRRGYKTGNYENARFGVAFTFFVVILFASKIVDPFFEFFFNTEIPNALWNIFSVVVSIGVTYYFAKKFYGHRGSRQWVVKHYDKITNIRKQSYFLQILLLTTLIIGYFLICYILGIRLRRFFDLPIME